MKVTKAIIPVAGKGTRFLPATKQTPKEMLPILNVPMIHYVVKEAVEAGIKDIIFITASGKESLENYFDRNLELEGFLAKAGKENYLDMIKEIGEMANITTIRQKQQLGLGHAVLMGESVISEDENFAVLLGDDLIISKEPVIKQLINASEENDNGQVIGVMEVPNDQTNKYGIVAGNKINERLLKMTEMVEKPAPENAPTNLATPGRYILSGKIFDTLKTIPKGAGGEYQLTDAINLLARDGNTYAYTFDGERYDTGSLQGYLKATIDFALTTPGLKEYAKSLIINKAKELSNE